MVTEAVSMWCSLDFKHLVSWLNSVVTQLFQKCVYFQQYQFLCVCAEW